MKKKIALVCCRGGSIGIKHKNIKKFNEKPLLYWTYKNINQSDLFDKIFLSTDDKKIAEYGIKLGFEVPQLRPKNLAKNNSDVFDTHKFFFKKNNINNKNSIACIINNNPFISSKIIRQTFNKFKNNNFKFITMCAIPVSHDQVFFRQSKIINKRLFPLFKNKLIKSKINRQQNSTTYVNIGDIRWGKPSKLTNYKQFNIEICKKGFEYLSLDNKIYHDLNTLNDWKIAENKFIRL
tara:strand:+ start:8445 stop:9152 length:708 start_codon:yes stop_codon:yes gene_type:complete